MSATATSSSQGEMPRTRISGVRCECAECGAHVMAKAPRGTLFGMCTVCGGSKLFRLEDRAAKE